MIHGAAAMICFRSEMFKLGRFSTTSKIRCVKAMSNLIFTGWPSDQICEITGQRLSDAE